MSPAESSEDRRRRLLLETQGRRLDEAYQHRDIRRDLHEEARDPDPDSIVTPEMIEQLHEYMGEMEGTGVSPGVLTPEPSAASRAFFSTDAVVVVPGFLGSSLSDTRPGGLGLIWVDPRLFRSDELGSLRLGPYDGREADANPDVRIVATGAIPVFYDLLRLALEARRYTTAVFAVDWRRDLEIAAQGLRDRLAELGSGTRPRPVHVVAHSQGAMVARRALQLLGEAEARRIVRHLVLLGPANAGSFAAALAFSGDHASIATLRRLTFEPAVGFRAVFASMSGLYQLLPWDPDRLPSLAEPDHAVGRPEFWRGKAPVDEARLAKFYGWARGVDTSFFDERTVVVLGDNFGKKTTAGVTFGTGGHLSAAESYDGDGTVPHCNAVLPGAPAYLAEATEHAMLPTYRKVIDAVRAALNDRSPNLPRVSSDPRAREYHR